MALIIDADGHIVEPRTLWQEYTEPAFRDRIPQIRDRLCGVFDLQTLHAEGIPQQGAIARRAYQLLQILEGRTGHFG